jgi:crotonyl-CoA carboxylase/reductase
MTLRSLYDIGEVPPLGHVPERMYASVIRPARYGEPDRAFIVEVVDTPSPGPDDVVVLVMAAGVNYNNVWAARGVPVDVTGVHAKLGERSDIHIGGSDAAGIVYAVGSRVAGVRVGDHVVVHCAQWDVEDASVRAGLDPSLSGSFRIWGYESNWGSFAQFARVQEQQCLPKAPQLTWEEAAAPTLVGATAYRMLTGWPPNQVRDGDPVLVWGGAGGLGSMAVQIARILGGRPVAVISSSARAEFSRRLGAVGTVDRRDFHHWGVPPHWTDQRGQDAWLEEARRFGRAFWGALGERRSPRIVLEHPGEDTLASSLFVCDTGGMVVTCGATTGYTGAVDLRYLWMRQKRLQGSHFANGDQCRAFNDLVIAGRIDPCLSRTFRFEEVGLAHQLMSENRHPQGNMAVLVSAPGPGRGRGARSRSECAD